MSIQFRANQSPMINRNQHNNQRVDLVARAAEMQESDGIDDTELQELQQIAQSDGELNSHERVLLESLQNESAEFDPASRTFSVNNRSIISDSANHDIVIRFDENPDNPAKQVQGDIESSQEVLGRLIPDHRESEWESIDKNDIDAVETFVESLNLSPQDRAAFTQHYLTSTFNHPGEDIEWGGASLEQGLAAVPSDEHGRKYIDCEAYALIASRLMGGEGDTTFYALDANNSGARNHQVGVYTSGSDAFIIDNNEVTRVPGGANTPPDELIQNYNSNYGDIAQDDSGPMRIGTEIFAAPVGFDGDFADLGRTVPNSNPPIMIEELVDSTTAKGSIVTSNGSVQSLTINVDPDSGQISSRLNPQPNDIYVDGDGRQITLDDPPVRGHFTDDDGTVHNVRVIVTNPDTGAWRWRPAR